jgi:hypothetical protein
MVLPRSSGTTVLPLPPHAVQLSKPTKHDPTTSQRESKHGTYTWLVQIVRRRGLVALGRGV